MAVADIKEKANEVREERASSLKGFFNNCFMPTKPIDGKNVEVPNYSENNTYSKIGTYSENDTLENAIYSENDTLGNNTCLENTALENDTRLENDTLENAIYSENDTHAGDIVKLAKQLGFTALGVLAVLIDMFPQGSGMLNVTQLSKSCGVARTTLIAQLRSLEKCGAVSLGNVEKSGRWLEILCVKNATCSENTTHIPCSSSCFNNKNYYYRGGYSGNTTHIENSTRHENAMYSVNNTCRENGMCNEYDIHDKRDTYIENTILVEKLSKSKITMKIAARELYFTAKASLTNINRLSGQCFQQFLAIKHSKGSNYAMALFLSLLSKSKENPTAYVIRAIQQGATPSQEDQRKAEAISRAGETVFKKIGEEILQRDLDLALSQIYLEGVSQDQIQDELDSFTKRISF
jgi:hypothetical protein